jgi:hypothetical protein
MRVAINLLTENPDAPSGAHWCWTRVVPEMAKRLGFDEELHLPVSPKSPHLYASCGPNVGYIAYTWSNERRIPRTLSEHIYASVSVVIPRYKYGHFLEDAIASALSKDCLRDAGIRQTGEFTWGSMAEATLDAYREVADRRRHRRA